MQCAQFFGGTADTGSDTTTAAPAVTDPADLREPCGVPADLDLGGETINIWCTVGAHKILNTEQTGDVLDDVIYNANVAVQERLNCVFNYVDSGFGSSTDTAAISTLLLADDTSYDLYLPVQWSGGKLVAEGLYLNVANAPYISFDKPWWDADYMREMSVGNDKIFTLVGDYSRHRTEMLNCIYYNKNLYDDFYKDPDGLYQTVLNGDWTLDKYHEICETVFLNMDDALLLRADHHRARQGRHPVSRYEFREEFRHHRGGL